MTLTEFDCMPLKNQNHIHTLIIRIFTFRIIIRSRHHLTITVTQSHTIIQSSSYSHHLPGTIIKSFTTSSSPSSSASYSSSRHIIQSHHPVTSVTLIAFASIFIIALTCSDSLQYSLPSPSSPSSIHIQQCSMCDTHNHSIC